MQRPFPLAGTTRRLLTFPEVTPMALCPKIKQPVSSIRTKPIDPSDKNYWFSITNSEMYPYVCIRTIGLTPSFVRLWSVALSEALGWKFNLQKKGNIATTDCHAPWPWHRMVLGRAPALASENDPWFPNDSLCKADADVSGECVSRVYPPMAAWKLWVMCVSRDPWQPVSEDKKRGKQKKGKTTHTLAEGMSEAVLKLPKNKTKNVQSVKNDYELRREKKTHPVVSDGS